MPCDAKEQTGIRLAFSNLLVPMYVACIQMKQSTLLTYLESDLEYVDDLWKRV